MDYVVYPLNFDAFRTVMNDMKTPQFSKFLDTI